MLKAATAPLALAIATFAATAPASAAEVQIQATNPVVELSVYEQIEVDPDVATIGAGVSTEALTAVEALRRNSAEMQRVVDLIKALGVPARDIQTQSINLNAQYDYNQNQPPRFRAYQASSRVSVELRDLDRVGEVLDALVSAGATDIFGPNFAIEDDVAAKAQARQAGLARGQAQAEEYARLAGYSGVRLLQVGESIVSSGSPPPPAPPPVRGRAMAEQAVMAPVEPGRVGTGVALALTYEMVR